MSKFIDLAKKLKELADRGVGGEKINATSKLKALMDKHGISPEDIEGEVKKTRAIKVKRIQRQFMAQIIGHVLGGDCKIFGSRRSPNEYIIECSDYDFIQIQTEFDFFWRAYENEVRLFTKAFIYKNGLVAKSDKPSESKLSKQEIFKLAQMMEGIDKHQLLKQIES